MAKKKLHKSKSKAKTCVIPARSGFSSLSAHQKANTNRKITRNLRNKHQQKNHIKLK